MATGRVPTTANSPLTAKGDLFTYSTAPARLAVSDDGSTLVADSAATTGLRWQGNYAAGKNKIINGDFNINQRGFTSTTTTGVFTFDRFVTFCIGGTSTYSAETFTLGTAPVAGYEGKNYLRIVTSGQSGASDGTKIEQRIENVRTFANQTITVSFWAKAASGTPSIAVEPIQDFSNSVSNTVQGQKVTISTSWARYSLTFNIPTIAGKTIAVDSATNLAIGLWVSSGSNRDARLVNLGIQSNTFDIWGLQVENGSVATAFQTATGTLQGEIVAAQRYYQRFEAQGSVYAWLKGSGGAFSSTTAYVDFHALTRMRVAPTSVDYGGTLRLTNLSDAGFIVTTLSLTGVATTPSQFSCNINVASGLTTGTYYRLQADNSGTAYIGFSAEL